MGVMLVFGRDMPVLISMNFFRCISSSRCSARASCPVGICCAGVWFTGGSVVRSGVGVCASEGRGWMAGVSEVGFRAGFLKRWKRAFFPAWSLAGLVVWDSPGGGGGTPVNGITSGPSGDSCGRSGAGMSGVGDASVLDLGSFGNFIAVFSLSSSGGGGLAPAFGRNFAGQVPIYYREKVVVHWFWKQICLLGSELSCNFSILSRQYRFDKLSAQIHIMYRYIGVLYSLRKLNCPIKCYGSAHLYMCPELTGITPEVTRVHIIRVQTLHIQVLSTVTSVRFFQAYTF